jgi:hypothetical protein
METSVAAAIVGPHRLPPSALATWVKAHCEDLHLGLGATRLGQMYSFHAPTKTNTPSVHDRPSDGRHEDAGDYGGFVRAVDSGRLQDALRERAEMLPEQEDPVGACQLRNDQAGVRPAWATMM